MDDTDSHQLANLGRGLVQINLKLSRVTELLKSASSGDASTKDPTIEILLDLLHAVEHTIAQLPPATRVLRWRSALGLQPAPLDLTGLILARDHAAHQLERAGLQPIPPTGPVDPSLHQVLDVEITRDPARVGTISVTHRTGWFRSGEPPAVVRFAQVTAWRAKDEV